MNNQDQHWTAGQASLKVTKKAEIDTFDDKVRPMGHIKVEDGRISILVGEMPSMASQDDCRDFVLDAIRMGLEQCWNAQPDCFVSRPLPG